MYLNRLFSLFTLFSKRNILSYTTINTNMKEYGEHRMKIERIYDSDNNMFFYSHIKDYDIDSEINKNQKIFITNKLEWYLKNRENYNVRYIPLYVTKIKKHNIQKLEELVQNNNIIKIEENNIDIYVDKWEKLDSYKNIYNIKNYFDKIYIVPSNIYQIAKTKIKTKFKDNSTLNKIELINNEKIVSCQNSLTLTIPGETFFTIATSVSYYLNYNLNKWHWFLDDEINKIMNPLSNILDLPIINIDKNLCQINIPVNEIYLNKILNCQRLSLNYLNNYEIDKFKNLNTAQECLQLVKDELKEL